MVMVGGWEERYGYGYGICKEYQMTRGCGLDEMEYLTDPTE